jgi:rare lipoprotein A
MFVLEKELFVGITRRLIEMAAIIYLMVLPQVAQGASEETDVVTGEASYYSQRFIGKRTTSGEPYDDKAYTAAHAYYPFGTYLLVTHLRNQQEVVVRVNDRFRPKKGHLVDLSMAAAKKIDLVRYGRGRITLMVLDEEDALMRMMDVGQLEFSVRTDSVTVPLPVPELKLLPTDLYSHDLDYRSH